MVFHDTGIGISEENLPHIFDPFFTTKGVGEGTGLGLAVTYSLVQRMNGTIAVESKPGQGSVFTITIPVAEAVRNKRSRRGCRPEDISRASLSGGSTTPGK